MKESQSPLLDIQELLNQGMGATLHWFPEDVQISRMAAVMVGMANGNGGIILLGVAPRSGHIQSLKNPGEAIERVFQAALLSDPPLILPVPRLHTQLQVQVLVITIPAGLPHVYCLDGRFLGREGIQTNPLPARRLRQLLLERGVIQFETQVPPFAALDDLDPEKIGAYIQSLNLPREETTQEILLRRGCLKWEKDILSPTYASLLLFGRSPQQWLPNATILAARFSGVSLSEHYIKQDIGGTLPDQIRQAEAFVYANLRSVVRLVGLTHQERPEYPPEAVRELLVNAVAHRDYNLQGDNIHLFIFADRIEIHSPGDLPGPVTLDNLLEARFSRNAIIVQVLSDLGFVERLGYGLDRVVTVMRQNGLRSPRFEEVAGSFRVSIYGEDEAQAGIGSARQNLGKYQNMSLNPRQELALGFLSRYRRITNRDYQELCPDVHPETLRRDLVELVSKDVVIKVGDKKATYYILK